MADVTIIGGGVIGLCSAIAIQDRGYDVEIVERGEIGRGASYGNCGLLAPSEIVPISRPGVIRRIPRWLLDPKGPLFVRSRGLSSDIGWLLRFVRSGRPDRVRQISAALAQLMRRVGSDTRQLLSQTDQIGSLSNTETLMLFDRREEYESDKFVWDIRSEFGFRHDVISRDEVRRLEPAIEGPITFGVVMRDWFHFTNPYGMVRRLADYFETRQGRIIGGTVTGIETQGKRATALHLAGGDRIICRNVVLTAGAWSGSIARSIGLRIPIAHLQGYHVQVLDPKVNLARAIHYASGGFVLTPMETGLRIGGTIEVAGPDPKPDYRRADILAERARLILPALDLTRTERWMGPRPFLPDTLPVIARAPDHSNIVLAFGHGQNGMTLGATTGKLVAELIAREPQSVDLVPFRADRF